VSIVEQKDAGVKLTYDPDGDNSLSGLDRFGRAADQVWEDGAQNLVDEYMYGYDRAGNRLWKQNAAAVGKALDELYTYAALDRLTNTQRGTLDLQTDPDNPTIDPASYQDWTLDGLGNFGTFDGGIKGAHILGNLVQMDVVRQRRTRKCRGFRTCLTI
jgi:hypothetical protein